MRRAATIVWAIAVVVASLSLPARPARADDVDVSLDGVVERGATPRLMLTVRRPVRRLRVEVRSEAGQRVAVERKGVRPGARVVVRLRHPPGQHHWEGTLSVRFADGGEGEMPLSFLTSNTGPLRLRSRATREALLDGTVAFACDRLPEKAEVKVFGVGGTLLREETRSFGSSDDPAKLEVTYTPPKAEVAKVSLRVQDAAGYTNGIDFFPWQVSIPHEEVVFASGKAEIPADQRPKLDAVVAEIRTMARRYGSTGDAILWIAGHTDTVADAATNQRLSEARARAIGRYFRAHGVRIPIRYRGFGESALAVPTPDETDEPRNRRAEYVLAAEDPYAGRAVAGTWKRLR